MGTTLKMASTNDHVSEIEQYIRTLEEKSWGNGKFFTFQELLIKTHSRNVIYTVFWLNSFPHNN